VSPRGARVVTALVAVGVLIVVGCPKSESRPRPQPEVRGLVVAYLECDECTGGEREAVVALGEPVVPTLIAILREGLSPAGRADLERQLVARYAARVAYEKERNYAEMAFTERQYVDLHVGNRDALYRVRSAIALGRIGSPEALGALREAALRPQLPSVEQGIRVALGDR